MPMSIEADLSQIEGLFDELEGSVGKAAAHGLYKGAGVVADALTAAIKSIKTEPFHFVREGEPKRLPSPQEVAALGQGQFGVAKFKGSGSEIQTSVGVGNAGYAHIQGSGKGSTTPVPLLAYAINSGTSFMQKQPFLRKAFNSSKGRAEWAIASTVEAELQSAIDAHE